MEILVVSWFSQNFGGGAGLKKKFQPYSFPPGSDSLLVTIVPKIHTLDRAWHTAKSGSIFYYNPVACDSDLLLLKFNNYI